MGEILQLSTRVLPLSYAAQIQGLPRLFRLAADFNGEGEEGKERRAAASTTLNAVDRLNLHRSRPDGGGGAAGAGGRGGPGAGMGVEGVRLRFVFKSPRLNPAANL